AGSPEARPRSARNGVANERVVAAPARPSGAVLDQSAVVPTWRRPANRGPAGSGGGAEGVAGWAKMDARAGSAGSDFISCSATGSGAARATRTTVNHSPRVMGNAASTKATT